MHMPEVEGTNIAIPESRLTGTIRGTLLPVRLPSPGSSALLASYFGFNETTFGSV